MRCRRTRGTRERDRAGAQNVELGEVVSAAATTEPFRMSPLIVSMPEKAISSVVPEARLSVIVSSSDTFVANDSVPAVTTALR